MQIKIIFALISVTVGTLAFFPYMRDIFLKKTEPHSYTWLIWSITQGTAVVGIWYGGGGIGALEFTIGTLLTFVVFLFSLKYGSKNITISDTVILIGALLAILAWWQLKNPFLSILMVCVIDVLGYVPSFRKSFQEPWSETIFTWVSFVVGNCFALLALQQYNFLTMGYIISISVANLGLVVICLIRRKIIPKPTIKQNRVMNAQHVLDIYNSLEKIGVKIWVDGGWSVDASLGKQTRSHTDLDIAIQYKDLPVFREYTKKFGYKELERDEDKKWNFVLGDGNGHEIDVHAFTFDENGHVVEGIEYPDGSLTGIGTIEGQTVRCIDPKHMVDFHTRYEPKEKDFKDVQALCEKFGIPYPEKYTHLKKIISEAIS